MSVENTVDFLIKNIDLKKSLDVLGAGEKFIKITKGDIILILGITGSGKSTFVQFLTTDGKNLTATHDQEGGDFLISDNDQRISTPTTISKTLFPELVIDEETRSNIYDCPGFSDTRSAAADIASTYFIKKLLDNAVRVKLIFLVNYPAVQKGVYRDRFMELLKHATSLVKNIEKYADGIALIATKVDNTQYRAKNGTYLNVPNEKKKQSIVNFFLETKDTLQKYIFNDTYTMKEHDFFRKSIKFIDIVTTKNNNDYFKLGLFNRPNQKGPIVNDKLLQENKKMLRQLVFYGTKYIPSSLDDFGYTISDKTLDKIHNIVNEINEEIFTNYKRIVQVVDNHISGKILKMLSFHEILMHLQADSDAWHSLLKDLKYIISPLHFLHRVTVTLEERQIETNPKILEDILNEISYFNYLQLVAGKSFNITRYMWFVPLNLTSKHLQAWVNWFYFLFEVSDTFSKYNIQKNINNNQFWNEWGLTNSPQGYGLNVNNFQQFFDKFKIHTENSYDYIASRDIDQLKIEQLNLILKNFFNSKNVRTTCSTNGILTITGQILILSEIIKFCAKCSKLKQIEIYATQKIIFDQNFNFDNYTIAIIAQNWDVFGPVNINLNGGKMLGISNEFTHVNLLSISQTSGFIHLYELQKQMNTLTPLSDTRNTFDDLIPKVVENYKYYLRANINDKTKRSLILTFLNDLSKYIVHLKEYDIKWFVVALQKLEEQFFELQYDDETLNFYKFLFEQITNYANKYFQTSSEEMKKILIYFCTAIQSKMLILKNNKEPTFIINLLSYIKSTVEDITKLNSLKNLVVINKRNEHYKHEIDIKINDIQSFVQQNVQSEINETINEFTDEIQRLIQEIKEMEQDLEKYREELKKHRKELVKKMTQRGIVGIFKIIGKIASFFGPIGMAVGGVIGVGTQVTDAIISNSKTALRSTPKMIDGINKATARVVDLDKYSIIDKRRENFYFDLDQLASEAKKHLNDRAANEITDLVEQTKKKMKESTQGMCGRTGVKVFKKIKKEFKKKLSKKQKELGIKPSKWERIQSIYTKSSVYIATATEVAEMSITVFDNFRQDSEEIAQVTKAIEETNVNILHLKQYNDQIENTLIPMVHSFGDYLKSLKQEIETQNKFQLDVSKWEMEGNLRKLKSFIKDFVKSNQDDIPSNMLNCAKKFEAVINLLINIFKQIETYQEHKQFTDYITELNSIDSKHNEVTDTKLRKSLDKLSYQIQANVVLDQHKKIIHNFYQWVFPFAKSFTSNFYLPFELTYDQNSTSLLLYKVTEQLEQLKRKLNEYNNTIFPSMDKNIHEGPFSYKYKSSESFYIWDNDHYNTEIAKLLAGHEISLYADVQKSNARKNAIKFSQIELDFTARDRTNETSLYELQNLLQYFKIRLTHMGNSHYRCKDKFYTISSMSQQIDYTYEKDQYGNPLTTNKVYKKLKNGDFLLSPYTLWKIKLIPTKDYVTFDNLTEFVHLINLELTGFGYYVQDNFNNCDDLDEYYELMDTQSKQQIVMDRIDREVARELKEKNYDIEYEDDEEEEDEERNVRSVDDYEEISVATSGGSIATSPINYLLNWMVKKLENVSTTVSNAFWVSEKVSDQTNRILKSLPDLSSSSSSSSSASLNSLFSSDLNGILFLTNYLTRLFTKKKFENFLLTNDYSTSSIHEAQILAINLTQNIQKNFLVKNKDNIDKIINFDGVNIQKQIYKLLINENFQEINEIFNKYS